MKKALSGLLAAVMVLSMGTTAAFAARSGYSRNFVDAGGDGACDNYTPGQGLGYGLRGLGRGVAQQ